MQNKAVRLHGTLDLRLDTFSIPEIKPDELLLHIVCDSLCMSSYKATALGSGHKRVPDDIDVHPIIVGHEFCGKIAAVGENCRDRYSVGQRISLQTTLSDTYAAPGYSYEFCGGDSQYAIIPAPYTTRDNVISYNCDSFFGGSLAEPYSCVIGAFHANYHNTPGAYRHEMGIKQGGNMALLAATGPMGTAAIDYILHCDRRPAVLVVTGRTQSVLDRCAALFPPEKAAENGVTLHYLNTRECENVAEELLALSAGQGYDDVFVYAPDEALLKTADEILGFDGCLNFFAGPADKSLSAPINFYNVHYNLHHFCGTSGGNTDDMREAIQMMEAGRLMPAALVTHIGGLDAAAEATLHLPDLKGGKKLIYTGISLPLTAIADFQKLGETQALFRGLAEICSRSNNLWSAEAEAYLLQHGSKL